MLKFSACLINPLTINLTTKVYQTILYVNTDEIRVEFDINRIMQWIMFDEINDRNQLRIANRVERNMAACERLLKNIN